MTTPGKAEIKMEQAFTLSPRGITTSNTRNKGLNTVSKNAGRVNGYQDGNKASRTIEFEENALSPSMKTGDKMRRTAHSKMQTAAGTASLRCET